DGKVFMSGPGQRRRIGPAKKRLAVDLPLDGAPAPGDGPVIAAAGGHPEVLALRLAAVVVLVVAADHREAVVPAAEDEDVAGRGVGPLVGVERLPVAVELDLE